MFLGRHHSSSSLAFALLFAGLLPPSAVIAATQGSGISVLTYGADPTGSTDSTAALQAAADAADAANTTLYVPDGLYRISSPIEIQSSVQLDASATVRATKPMPAVFRVGSSAVVAQTSFRGGIIDAANQAQDGIFFRQYAHIRVADVLVKNASANGFHFGDPSFAANSYEAVASGLSTVRDNGLFLTAGSTGLYIESTAVDGSYSQSVFAGSDYGVRVFTGGNFFTDVHVWSPVSAGWMTVGFDDNGTGNFWKGCEADTVQTYGMRVHWYNTSIVGCRFYNNKGIGQDSVPTAIYFDHSSPGAAIFGTLFFGGDVTHRFAADMVGPTSGLTVQGNQSINVVKALTIGSTVPSSMTVRGSLSSIGTESAGSYYAVAAPATSAQNTTTSLSLGTNWYDSGKGTANSYAWSLSPSQSATGTPSTADLFLFTKGTLPSGVNPRFFLGATSATSSVPQRPSTQQVFQASYYSNSAASFDSWGIQDVLSSGSTPTSTLALTHWGGGAAATVSVPALSIGSDTLSSLPRLTWTPFGTCSMANLNCQESSLWNPSRGIIITQWTFTLGTAAAGCSQYPILALQQGSTVLATVQVTSGNTNFVGGHSLAIRASSSGGSLAIVVSKAASGCTTYPSASRLRSNTPCNRFGLVGQVRNEKARSLRIRVSALFASPRQLLSCWSERCCPNRSLNHR